MYSAVLMLALTAGSETVDFGRNRGCACSNGCSTVVYGNSGCSGSLFGGHHGGCGSSYGCGGYVGGHGCGGSVVSYGCSGSYGCSSSHGCNGRGGLFGRPRGHGCSSSYGCCGGYVGCTNGYVGGCTSGYPVPVQGGTIIEKKAMPKGGEQVPLPKPKTETSAPATIVVTLPADARLFVDGNATTSTSDRRTLVTPELAVGQTYAYTMRAEVVRNGQVQTQTQQVNVIGGQTAQVQFNLASQGVASR